MRLTEKDKIKLRGLGYSEKDIPQISAVISCTTYENKEGRLVELASLLKNMERDIWLSGIARAAFHRTALRFTRTGDEILFDSSAYFRQ